MPHPKIESARRTLFFACAWGCIQFCLTQFAAQLYTLYHSSHYAFECPPTFVVSSPSLPASSPSSGVLEDYRIGYGLRVSLTVLQLPLSVTAGRFDAALFAPACKPMQWPVWLRALNAFLAGSLVFLLTVLAEKWVSRDASDSIRLFRATMPTRFFEILRRNLFPARVRTHFFSACAIWFLLHLYASIAILSLVQRDVLDGSVSAFTLWLVAVIQFPLTPFLFERGEWLNGGWYFHVRTLIDNYLGPLFGGSAGSEADPLLLLLAICSVNSIVSSTVIVTVLYLFQSQRSGRAV